MHISYYLGKLQSLLYPGVPWQIVLCEELVFSFLDITLCPKLIEDFWAFAGDKGNHHFVVKHNTLCSWAT